MIDPAVKAAADFLLTLPKDERTAAGQQINQLVKAQAPPSDSEPDPAPIRSLAEYLEHDFPVPPFLVSHGQLCRGEITAMVARAGKGKTTLAQNRIIRWAAGLPLFSEEGTESQIPEGPLKILLIENEGTAWHMQQKLGQLLSETAGLNEDQKELARENAMIWGDGGYSNLKIDREKDYDEIRRGLDKHKPDVLYMEPWRKFWQGEENSATEVEAVLDKIVALASEFNCAVLLAHHARKSVAEDGDFMTEARGSVVLEDTVAVMEHYKPAKGGELRELAWSKSRYAPVQAPLRIDWDPNTWRISLVPQAEIAGQVLKMMTDDPDGWFWVKDLAEELDESERKMRVVMEELVKEERVLKRRQTSGERQGYRYRLSSGEGGNDGIAI